MFNQLSIIGCGLIGSSIFIYTRSIGEIVNVNGQDYYDGVREDDRPYAYLSEMPNQNVDLKLYKTFGMKLMKMKMYFEIENLLDELTPRRINPYTGTGYNPGEIYGYHLANSPNPNDDPSRYRKPRSVEVGIQLIF